MTDGDLNPAAFADVQKRMRSDLMNALVRGKLG